MAKQKDSFVVYYSWEEICEDMTDAQCGELFRALFAYEKRGERYSGKDPYVKMAMKMMAQALDLNREKYLERCEKNRKSIQKRWEKRSGAGKDAPADTNEYKRIQPYTKHTDNDNDNETEYEIDIESDSDNDNENDVRRADPYPCLFFEQNIGAVSSSIRQEIVEAVSSCGEAMVLEAMQTAQRKGANSWGYVKGILGNWKRQGHRSNALIPGPLEGNDRSVKKWAQESQQWMRDYLGETEDESC